jgi:hypothetical protein
VAQAAYLAYGLYMPTTRQGNTSQTTNGDSTNPTKPLLLEDALTGQRFLDLPIVQTYSNIA